MPTYEYECTQCERHFEVVQKFSDDPLTSCDVCGGAVRKVYGSVGVVFKGSGFYKTDSRSSGTKSSSSGASDTKTESKSTETSTTPKTDASTSTPAAPVTSSSSSD